MVTLTAKTRPIPRRGLSREEAAAYLGISPSRFDEKRKAGEVPAPRRDGARRLWDAWELDDVEEEPKPGIDPALLIRGVYVVGFDDYVKIGWSNLIHWRRIGGQCGRPLTAADAVERLEGVEIICSACHETVLEIRLETFAEAEPWD